MTLAKVLIVDDEPLARRRLRRVLGTREDIAVIGEAGNVREAQRLVEEQRPDIIFLDVQMPGGDGFSLLEALCDPAPTVVFVTAFDQHAVRAFEARAVDYVLKPADESRIVAALDRALIGLNSRDAQERLSELHGLVATLRHELAQRTARPREIWVSSKGRFVRVTASEVWRVEAEGDYVRIHTPDRSLLYVSTLGGLRDYLGPDEFTQVRRNALVRRDKIDSISSSRVAGMVVVLQDGTEVRVGRTFEKTVRADLARRGKGP